MVPDTQAVAVPKSVDAVTSAQLVHAPRDTPMAVKLMVFVSPGVPGVVVKTSSVLALGAVPVPLT